MSCNIQQRNRSTLLMLAGILLATSVLTGCATSANTQRMTVSAEAGASPNPALKGRLQVISVSGGKDTNPFLRSEVDDAGFKGALSDSLAQAGYLVEPGGQGQYKITATLLDVDGSFDFGGKAEVKSNILYLIENGSKLKSVPVTAMGSATLGESFLGNPRMGMARERAIQQNIREFLQILREPGAEKLAAAQAIPKDKAAPQDSGAGSQAAECVKKRTAIEVCNKLPGLLSTGCRLAASAQFDCKLL